MPIGTSPLYALREAVKAGAAGGAPTSDAVTGAVSVILWALILIVTLKYAILILRADNRGEGGIVAVVVEDALCAEQSLDLVGVLDPLGEQRLLAAAGARRRRIGSTARRWCARS
jgi:K+ transporter